MIDYLRQLNFVSMSLRIVLAMLVGGLIGLERERKNRGAGFRTYMLVALGAAMTIILSQYLDMMLNTAWGDTAAKVGVKTDVSRFGAQVINGVGFLGAGTIIVTKHQEVKGLTTAAGLWASACMGLAVGAGFYECVLISFLLVFLIMRILPAIENAILSRSRYMNINVSLDSMDYISGFINACKQKGIRIFDVDIDRNEHQGSVQAGVVFNILLPEKKLHEEVIAGLSVVDGVIAIDEI